MDRMPLPLCRSLKFSSSNFFPYMDLPHSPPCINPITKDFKMQCPHSLYLEHGHVKQWNEQDSDVIERVELYGGWYNTQKQVRDPWQTLVTQYRSQKSHKDPVTVRNPQARVFKENDSTKERSIREHIRTLPNHQKTIMGTKSPSKQTLSYEVLALHLIHLLLHLIERGWD